MDLPNRKSIRLRDYDYSSNGGYFITICTEQRQEVLGQISVGVGRDQPEIILNKQGQIVMGIWESLPNHHPVVLDTFQIMPNHIHFILFIKTGASRYGLTKKNLMPC